MTERAPDLLPCPFCGCVPGFGRRQDEDLTTHNIVWWDRVYCMECDVGFEWPEHHEVTAAIQWNTRVRADGEEQRSAGLDAGETK